MKLMLGKLTLRKPLDLLVQDWIQKSGLVVLSVRLEHVLRLDALPAHHKDPFDRLLIAQALVEGAVLVTHDPAIAQYPVDIVW